MTPQYSSGERVVDGALHVIGVGASLAALTALLVIGAHTDTSLMVLGLTIYGVALVVTFGCSAGYHLAVHPKAKELLRRLEAPAAEKLFSAVARPFKYNQASLQSGLGIE